jgi:hypothetical protein
MKASISAFIFPNLFNQKYNPGNHQNQYNPEQDNPRVILVSSPQSTWYILHIYLQ